MLRLFPYNLSGKRGRAVHKLQYLIILAVILSGILAASSSATVTKFNVSPARPYVDDSVTISWRADRNLKPGQHYEGDLTDEPLGDCASLVIHRFSARPQKGQMMRMTFSSYEDPLTGGPQWCDGKAQVFVDVVDQKGHGEGFVGIVGFRFYRQP
jgi:hypothetical protein